MANYKEMYLTMARATEKAIQLLITAQQTCEELYLSSEEDSVLHIVTSDRDDSLINQEPGRR